MNQNRKTGPNFVMRMVLGAVGIAFCNQILKSEGIEAVVGINPISLLTIGSLGISGFALLYGIILSKFL